MWKLKPKLTRWLFALAKTKVGSLIIRGVFTHMTFLLPVERLRETTQLIAFYHPRPQHPVHILIVPKKDIRRMTDITEDDSALLVDIFQTVKSIIDELGIAKQDTALSQMGESTRKSSSFIFIWFQARMIEAVLVQAAHR
jgi:hypothetical protein